MHIDDELLSTLGKSSMDSLSFLDLSDNNLTDEQLNLLSNSNILKNLLFMNISKN